MQTNLCDVDRQDGRRKGKFRKRSLFPAIDLRTATAYIKRKQCSRRETITTNLITVQCVWEYEGTMRFCGYSEDPRTT